MKKENEEIASEQEKKSKKAADKSDNAKENKTPKETDAKKKSTTKGKAADKSKDIELETVGETKKVEKEKPKSVKGKPSKKDKGPNAARADAEAEESAEQEETKIIELKDGKEHEKLIKFEEIKNIFKKKRKLPKEALGTVIKPVFNNIVVAIIVMLYFIFLILGFYNIENSVYEVDLKVFAMCILFIAIMLLEKAYRDDNGKIAAFGIEAIVISIITLGLIYVNLMFSSSYIITVLIASYILAIYYVAKSIVLYQRGKNKYFVDNMKEIMNTDE